MGKSTSMLLLVYPLLRMQREISQINLSLACVLKQEGNEKFRLGKVEEAVKKYSEAIDMCGLEERKKRIVIYSNRAQCYLILGDAEEAIRDTTRALGLCHVACPHSKSLWRISQAYYDMKGFAKESLINCLTFIRSMKKRRVIIPYDAARMLNKQMNATWIFASARSERSIKHSDEVDGFNGQCQVDVKTLNKENEGRTRKSDRRTRTNVSRQRF